MHRKFFWGVAFLVVVDGHLEESKLAPSPDLIIMIMIVSNLLLVFRRFPGQTSGQQPVEKLAKHLAKCPVALGPKM